MEKIVLDNGLRIVLDPLPGVRSASMGVWVASGTYFEAGHPTGISHYLEHMFFKGTPTRSAVQIAEQMDAMGGALNAYTAKEYTCFYARSLTEHVTDAFDIIADMLTHPAFAQRDMDTEKDVIIEEIGMYEDSPEDVCSDRLYESVWQGTPLGNNILGTRESVANTTREDLLRYKSLRYLPERMVIVISGAFDRASFLALCTRYFGALKPAGDPLAANPIPTKPALSLLEKDYEQTQICIGFPGTVMNSADRYAHSILLSILGASSSSRLYQRIREELGLVYGIDAYSVGHLAAGLTVINAALAPKSEEAAFLEIFKVLKGFRESITEREMLRAKEQYKAGLIMGLEQNASRASHMGRSELLQGRILMEDDLIAKVHAVTLADVQALAQRLFDPAQLSLSVTGKLKKHVFYNDIVKEAGHMI